MLGVPWTLRLLLFAPFGGNPSSGMVAGFRQKLENPPLMGFAVCAGADGVGRGDGGAGAGRDRRAHARGGRVHGALQAAAGAPQGGGGAGTAIGKDANRETNLRFGTARQKKGPLNDGRIQNPSNPFGIVPLSNFVLGEFGFVHHSIAILDHEVPNPNLTIRDVLIAVAGGRAAGDAALRDAQGDARDVGGGDPARAHHAAAAQGRRVRGLRGALVPRAGELALRPTAMQRLRIVR